jgi:DNA topoisomerase IB
MKDNSKFGSSQSLIDSVNEVLKGGQKKLDKNNNGKIDGDDFKKLRGDDEVDEVAASMTQQRAAGAALATQRGEYDGGKKGGAINRMSAMKASDLMKIAGTKKKELPMRKEEAEQMDELSKSTMGSYIKRASFDLAGRVGDERVVHGGVNRARKNKIQNRERGILKAVDKLTKEEAEQMDELSKSTMGSYIKKAAADVAKKSAATDPAAAADRRAAHRMSLMRRVGIEKATDKLTKEDAVMKAIKSMKAMKAKESTSY